MRKCAAKAQILSKCRIRHSSQSAYFDAVALPSTLPDSEFGDPELGPLGMRDMLRNATFSGFFEILGTQVFDASS